MLIIIYIVHFTKLFIENKLLKIGNLFTVDLLFNIYWAEIINIWLLQN